MHCQKGTNKDSSEKDKRHSTQAAWLPKAVYKTRQGGKRDRRHVRPLGHVISVRINIRQRLKAFRVVQVPRAGTIRNNPKKQIK